MTITHRGRSLTLHKRDRTDTGPGPWYWRSISLGTEERGEATRRARQAWDERAAGQDRWAAHRAATGQRHSLTIGALADQWITAGYPDDTRTPRAPRAVADQSAVLRRLLAWWSGRGVATITGQMIGDYAVARMASVQRRPHVGRDSVEPSIDAPSGGRTVDRELTCLSNLFAWGISAGHVTTNPFASRPTYCDPATVSHASERCPDADEQLHALMLHIWSQPSTPQLSTVHIAAAQLTFQALTGLRPGEPGFLRHQPPTINHQPSTTPPGTFYTRRPDGAEIPSLAIQRAKGGLNPVIRVHPVLRDFLDWWLPLVQRTFPGNPYWFPRPGPPSGGAARPLQLPGEATHALSGPLRDACQSLGLHRMTPHGMRAYYKRVRTSQGVDDLTIGIELGERTGAKLMATTYGSASQHHATGALDWLPTDGPPWWHRITVPASNIIPLAA